jgi:hypothetical protein
VAIRTVPFLLGLPLRPVVCPNTTFAFPCDENPASMFWTSWPMALPGIATASASPRAAT